MSGLFGSEPAAETLDQQDQVLIQAGNAYALPGAPVMAAFNHVIIYLPQFSLYDDPTVRFSAFGVLDAHRAAW